MYLYNLTLQRATNISHCVAGNFSGTKKLEIIVSRGKILEIFSPDENTGKLQSLLSVEIFGIIRSIIPFRLTGGTKDYVIIGSDSGRVVILEYNPTKNVFDKVHQETFGKSGCRRIVPGQYIATDPRGRAVMIAAIEKQKLVFILNRDSAARLTISSPLEAHKAHTIVFSMCGVDVGYENPIFACLEVDYDEAAQMEAPTDGSPRYTKNLTFYELDLGLNHVVRKWTDATDPNANLLIPVPGGADGPGGVLVCAENYIIYKNQGVPEKRTPIPRREGSDPNKPLLIVSFATHKQKDLFFFLVQTEVGDLYKVSLPYTDDEVTDVVVKYFDTVPISNSMCVLKNGFLFVASEFGNHMFYQFQGLGDDTDDVEATSDHDTDIINFRPRALRNLKEVDKLDSLSPILDFKVLDLFREETPQLYALCGRGPRSSLRVLRHGLEVTEVAVSGLPMNPSAVWTVKRATRDENDKYIVVSSPNSTLVLAVGENVEEVHDSGFLGTTSTLVAINVGEDGLLQVHPNGIRHIRGDRRVNEWKTPGKKTIAHATANELQVAIALSGGELFYFELDATGQMTEVAKRDMGRDVACLGIAPISKGRQRGQFLAVGDWENTVRILSLSPEDPLQQVAMQALPTQPESLVIVEMDPTASANAPSTGLGTLFLNIGLRNGVLLRTVLDHVTGELTDTRSRLLGVKPVKLFKVKIRGANAVLALSSRPWVAYTHAGRFHMTPLSYVQLDYGAQFTSDLCPEGIVAISSATLRIITLDKLGEMFNQIETPLRYTPRRFVLHPLTNLLIIIETDHNAYPEAEREEHKYEVQKTEDAAMAGDDATPTLDMSLIGAPPAGDGKWASCIRLYDVYQNQTLQLLELEDNEAAVCMCTCVFHEKVDEVFVVVGTAKDSRLKPRRNGGGFVHVYKVENRQLVLVHKTPMDDAPTALCPFQGRLLVGVGKVLRIYDMGKKKLLRKCENKNFPNVISAIHTQGDRIICADVQESFHFVKYKRSENSLYIFADDTAPRYITASSILDYDTMAGADKFGNLFVVRLPEKVNEDIEDDPTGNRVKWEQGWLNGAPYKVEHQIHFHAGETINSIAKAALVPGATEVLLYTTVTGAIGALIPFASREDVDFFSHLEMHLRQENPPLCGRDHLSYRSYYFPVKNVIDGDLCEQFTALDATKQRAIAQELDRTPSEVAKKLEDMRNNRLL